jgi:hypothetical protein
MGHLAQQVKGIQGVFSSLKRQKAGSTNLHSQHLRKGKLLLLEKAEV